MEDQGGIANDQSSHRRKKQKSKPNATKDNVQNLELQLQQLPSIEEEEVEVEDAVSNELEDESENIYSGEEEDGSRMTRESDGTITFTEPSPEQKGESPPSIKPHLSHPWYRDGNVYRLVIMLTLTFVMFLAEIIVGFITGSLALVSDAFHMASDGFALLIGLIALQMAKRQTPSMRYSYGLARAEVIGGLVNGVFLFSVSLFILFEAIGRFIDEPEIDQPLLIVYVGAAGLLMNIFGMFLFIGHSGVGHGHSHGGGGHSHGKKKKHGHSHGKKKKKKGDIEEGHDEHQHEEESKEGEGAEDKEADKPAKKKKRLNSNLHGVFLHILGDALASIGAIITGLLIEFVPWEHRFYFDPIVSVLISLLIMKSAIPLILSCTQILMQSAPKGVDIAELTSTVQKIKTVLRVHDLHVWQLLNDRTIGSVHVQCEKSGKFMKTARKIKKVFHDFDIHSVTIQPEFIGEADANGEHACLLPCADEWHLDA